MQIDEAKIDRKIQELNVAGGNWFAADGLNALTGVEFHGTSAQFKPATGIPVKVFINRVNGEMKVFPAVIFKVDE